MPDNARIESLITLYLDPDPRIHTAVQDHLVGLGEAAIPLIDQMRSRHPEGEERSRLDRILRDISFPGMSEEYANLIEGGVHDIRRLEQSILLLSRLDQPTIRTDSMVRQLDYLAQEAADRFPKEASSRERMRIFLEFIFKEQNFRGDRKDYHAIENGFLHKVLERRAGIPLTLSLVVLFVSDRLGLPFHGVNLPVHFLLMFDPRGSRLLIDPFDEGAVVSLEQCHVFLRHNRIPAKTEFFEPCVPLEILKRHLRNLHHSYGKAGDEERVRSIDHLLMLTEHLAPT
jgi:regulator of sirC expression with transglutaminase-like and TPR domain